MKSLRIRRNTGSTESFIISNLSKLISYLGLFPTYNQLSTEILQEIEQTAISNRKELETSQEPLSQIGPSQNQEMPLNIDAVVPITPINQTKIPSAENANNPALVFPEKNQSEISVITFFSYEEMEETIISLLFSQDLLPINLLDFRKAFKALDPSGQGWIKQSTLIYMLKRLEKPFSEEEITNFILFVGNRKIPDKIFYEDYLINFYEYVNSHIKKLYQTGAGQM